MRRRHSLSDPDSKAHVQPNGKGDGIDDSLAYIHKKTSCNEDHARHRSYIQEGALVGLGAEELLWSHRRREDKGTSDGMSRIGRDVGAVALPAAVLAATHTRDYNRSRSRRRSPSPRAKSLAECAAEIARVPLTRNRANDRRSCSRGRSRSRQRRIGLVSGAASEDEGNDTDDSMNGDDIVQDLVNRYTTL